MDKTSRAYYEVYFENCFLKYQEKEFQNFFSRIMETCYSHDFIPIRPWGKFGDRKNDGYLSSTQTVHQVYAPNTMKLKDTLEKIDADFSGALEYWNGRMKKWVFVHNSRSGLSADIVKKLEDFKIANPSVIIEHMGYSELRRILFSLRDQDIESILGPAPTENGIGKIGFEDLKIVLKSISKQKPVSDMDLRPVPQDKIVRNKLSANVEILIKTGMRKSRLVENFFTKWHDPTFGDKIAESFRIQYNNLKAVNLTPDDIFMELIKFAGGSEIKGAGHHAAVLAVVAFFFEQCDIFERPDEVIS